jgi:hypothetical protein
VKAGTNPDNSSPPCSGDNDCGIGYACVGGTCSSSVCRVDNVANIGAPDNCCTGLSGPECMLATGAPCDSPDDCSSGTCVEGASTATCQ